MTRSIAFTRCNLLKSFDIGYRKRTSKIETCEMNWFVMYWANYHDFVKLNGLRMKWIPRGVKLGSIDTGVS